MAEDFNLEAPNQERDLNNNGIVDIHEPSMQPPPDPSYKHDESYEVGRENTSGAPIVRSQREAMAHLAAAFDSSTRGQDEPETGGAKGGRAGGSTGPGPGKGPRSSRKDRVHAENAAASKLEKDFGSDPNKAIERPNYENALHKIDLHRTRNAANKKKSKLSTELAATRPHKEDKATGAEILTELFKGLQAGTKHGIQRINEQEHEKNQLLAEAMELQRANEQDKIDQELAIKARHREDGRTEQGRPERGPASGGASDGRAESGGDGGPSDPGPGGGPGDKGPTGGGPSDGPEGPSGPSAANSNEASPKPANDVEPETAPTRTAAPVAGGMERAMGSEAVGVHDVGIEKGKAAPEQDMQRPAAASDRSSAQPDAGSATGASGLGAVLTTVNPALGIAATAVQTQGAQRISGNDHAGEVGARSKSPAPNAAGTAALSQFAKRPKVAVAAGQPERSLVSADTLGSRDRIVTVPLRRPKNAGRLFEQAANLSRPSSPVVSRGLPAPSAPPRALGVGLGYTLSGMLKAAQPVVVRNEGPSLEEQRAFQQSRSGSSMGR